MKNKLFILLCALFMTVSCGDTSSSIPQTNSSPNTTSETTSIESNPSSESQTSQNNSSISESSQTSSSYTGDISVKKSNIIGLPNHEYELEFENTTNEQIMVVIGDNNYSLMNVSIISNTKVKVSLLSEGKGFFTLRTLSNPGVRIDIESINLTVTNDTDHIDVGQSLQLTLSSDKQATYEVNDEEIATVTSTGLITVHKKGVFEVTIKYGEIVIVKNFDSYERLSNLTSLNRNNPFIKYHGRNVHENGYVIMNNTASGFEVTFFGTKLVASLDAWYGSWYGQTQVSVLVDGEKDTTKKVVILNKATTQSDYTLVSGLDEGVHTVKVLKRTEALSSSMTLFSLKTDGYFKPVDKTEKLKIEAYGDSITAGYGNLRPTSNPDYTDSVSQSGLQTYATYTAWELDADINVQARSGIGMYTSGNVQSGTHVKDYYNKVNYDGEYDWNFNNYIPDIVIINLGTNDFWDGNNFNLQTFKTEYVNTVTSLANIYGEDTSFILASGLMENNVNAHLPDIKTKINNNVTNDIHIIKFPQCEYGHPLASEHKKASETLVQYIKDNNLDIIHTKSIEEVEIAEATNKNVSIKLNVETQDVLPSYCDLYVKGLGENVKLQKVDAFNYSATTTLKEGDYNLSFIINNEEQYKEYDSNHLIQVRENNNEFNLKLDSFLSLPDEPIDNVTFGWNQSAHAFESTFTATNESNVSILNKNWMAGFVYKKAKIKDNYKLSMTIQTNSTINDQTYVGYCPYYVDDLNYIVIYLQWYLNGSVYAVKGIGCTGAIDGKDIGWNDFWSFKDMNINLSQGVVIDTFKNGNALTVKIGNVQETQTFFKMGTSTQCYALWSYTDKVVNYTNISQVSDTSISAPSWIQSPCLSSQTYQVISDNEVTLQNDSNWLAGFIVRGTDYRDNYTLEATITAEKDSYPGDNKLGLVPLYIDSNNFIVCYLQWDNQGLIPSIVLTGLINGQDIGFQDIWDFQGTASSLTKGDVMKVSRNNTKFTVTYGGKTFTKYINSIDGLNNYGYGVWNIRTGNVRYSNITMTESL